jgi:hypothetical protein
MNEQGLVVAQPPSNPQAFLAEYEALCRKHGLRLAPVLVPVDVLGKSVLTLDLGLQQYAPPT